MTKKEQEKAFKLYEIYSKYRIDMHVVNICKMIREFEDIWSDSCLEDSLQGSDLFGERE